MAESPDLRQPGVNSDPAAPVRRFAIVPGNLLEVLQPGLVAEEPLEPDDPQRALGKRVVRLDFEPEFATLYLTFDGGSYLVFASRIDEDDGLVLLDRFVEGPARYSEYYVDDDLHGESGPAPAGGLRWPGSPFDPSTWKTVEGKVLYHLGWDEEGMQGYIHFDDGAYLTVAARASAGVAYLLGYFAATEPEDGEFYEFDLPDGADGEASDEA